MEAINLADAAGENITPKKKGKLDKYFDCAFSVDANTSTNNFELWYDKYTIPPISRVCSSHTPVAAWLNRR